MNSPKNKQETPYNRTLQFNSDVRYVQYTAEETTNQDDSLLLTPGCQDKIVKRKSSGTKSKEIDNSAVKLKQKIEEEQKLRKKKREAFRQRLTMQPAFFEENEYPQTNPEDEPDQPIQPENRQPQANNSQNNFAELRQIDNVPPEFQNISKDPLNKLIQKVESAQKQSSSFSNHTEIKVEEVTKPKLSDKKLQDEEAKTKVEEKKVNPRLTMDVQTFFALNVQDDNANNTFAPIAEQSSPPLKRPLESNEQLQSIKAKRMSMIQKAAKRFSGVKMPPKSRITMDVKDYLIWENKKNEMVQNLDQLKQSSRQKAEIYQEQAQYFNTKEILNNYFEKNSVREKLLDEQLGESDEENNQLKRSLQIKQAHISELDQEIQREKRENQEIDRRKQMYESSLGPQQELKKSSSVIFYIEQKYNIKIIKFEVNHSPCPYSTYHLDFILDKQINCRFKKIENSSPIVIIKQSSVLNYLPSSLIIDPKLRVELLTKYSLQKINSISPMEMMINLGQFYEKLSSLEDDIQAIYNVFSTKDPIWDAISSTFAFYLEELKQDITLKVSINFLEFGKQTFYQLEFIQPRNKKIIQEEKEPKDIPIKSIATMYDFGTDQTLCLFVINSLLKI